MDGDPQICVAAESDSITYFLHIWVAINKLTQIIISSQTEHQRAAIRRSQETSAEFVPYLGLAEVQELAHAAERTGKGKKAERDKLLIETLFDGCFRVSEALGIRTSDMVQTDAGWQ